MTAFSILLLVVPPILMMIVAGTVGYRMTRRNIPSQPVSAPMIVQQTQTEPVGSEPEPGRLAA